MARICPSFITIPQKIAYSRPFIGGIQIGHVTYEETTYICKIGVKLLEETGDSETTNGECWHGLFGRPVVVEGFPIPRRSEGESPGLEIPLNIMAVSHRLAELVLLEVRRFLRGSQLCCSR